ncbi:NlpC/P60 family protein [Streptomyces sp. NPDC047071]|uniref:C40 family peptidase n=1 Tax=Streptomyces sp. NPDC047071 TaxID=3154808 RepID=UPI0034563120
MQIPEFTDEKPVDCACAACAGTAALSRADRRCTVRGAVVAAVGAAVLVGTASGTASAEPAPSRAGWDGSKYWYKDATGWWRWTSHYDKYAERVADSGSSGKSRKAAGSSPSGRTSSSEPTFRGRAGFDAADGVYWFRKGGHWHWTRHKSKYEQCTGGSSSGASSPSPSLSRGKGRHPAHPTFRGRAGWDAVDRVYWYQRDGGWWWTSHRSKYQRYAGTSSTTGGAPSGTSPGSGTPRRHGTEAAIAFATAHLGDAYVWGGNGPHGWDCSGLVMAAYRTAGISLPRVADAQYRATTPVSRGDLRRGDLVFWSSNGSASGIHHVAIYLGGGQYLEAPRPGKQVRISSFDRYEPNMYGRVH